MATLLPAAPLDELDNAFDDHPSLSDSLEDFEEHQRRSPLFDLPSQHSGFKSEQESDIDDGRSSSAGAPWSPPGFRKPPGKAGSWFRHDPYGAAHRLNLRPTSTPHSRQTSPEYESAMEGEDITLAANIPLPPGTDSPTRDRSPEPEINPLTPVFEDTEGEKEKSPSNFIRFAVKAEVQHKEPLMALVNFLRDRTKNKSSTFFTLLTTIAFIATVRMFFIPPTAPPVPDLVKLSNLARSFEPLIYYSENGYAQDTALQETSIAVWDLAESMRDSKMGSTPVIVETLDQLSGDLKTLGKHLKLFFADVDMDIDSIINVMEYSKRKLGSLSSTPSGPFLLLDNVHSLLNHGNLLEFNNRPTALGTLLTSLVGASTTQRTRTTLAATFSEFLSTLEESIRNELRHSTALFTLFESVDRRFLTLQRAVVRESDAQHRAESELLTGLWARVMGPRRDTLAMYENNRRLLADVRARTLSNKRMIVDHNSRLLRINLGLEALRRKLVSPLLRQNDSLSAADCGAIVREQIAGLEGTYQYLRKVRQQQREKLNDLLYNARGPRMVSFGGG